KGITFAKGAKKPPMSDQDDFCLTSRGPTSAPSNRNSELMEAVFRVDGDRVTVSPHAAGPWDPTMQHGSAPASLVVWAAEAIPSAVPMRIARASIDLMRPVPLKQLALETEILREGRKIQLCAVRLRADGVLAVAATVLKVRHRHETLPLDVSGPKLELPLP